MDCSVPGSSIHGIQFSRQEYWSGLPFCSPRYFPDPGIEPRSPALQADSLPSEPPGEPPVVLNSELNEFICEKSAVAPSFLGQGRPLASASSLCHHVLPPCQPISCYWIFSPIAPKTPSMSFTPTTSTWPVSFQHCGCPSGAQSVPRTPLTTCTVSYSQGGRLHRNEVILLNLHFRKVDRFWWLVVVVMGFLFFSISWYKL